MSQTLKQLRLWKCNGVPLAVGKKVGDVGDKEGIGVGAIVGEAVIYTYGSAEQAPEPSQPSKMQ